MATDAPDRTAMDKVFDITELHETILSHLPPKDILLAQRVSKTWKATIKGSLMLQRALGFVASSNSFVNTSASDTGYLNRQKPSSSTGMKAAQFVEASNKPGACVITPLLECLCEKEEKRDFFLLSKTKLKKLANDKTSSWNCVRLTQPPITHALMWFYLDRGGLNWVGTDKDEDTTFGDVFEKSFEIYGKDGSPWLLGFCCTV